MPHVGSEANLKGSSFPYRIVIQNFQMKFTSLKIATSKKISIKKYELILLVKVVRTFFLVVPQLILPQTMLDPHLYLFPLYEKNTETHDSGCFITVSAFRRKIKNFSFQLFTSFLAKSFRF